MVIEIHYNPERFWAKVDKTGDCWLWTASVSSNGYGQFATTIAGVNAPIGAHRVAYYEANGPIAAGLVVDHICHNKLCMNPAHLRAVTQKQNGENRGGAPSDSTSGVRGVTWAKRQRRWKGTVRHNGRQNHVGYFRKIADAEEAVVARRNELHTHNDLDRQAV
jgi:hypothetical protein